MLSIYQAPRRSSEGSDSTIELERVIPAGQPYLTKVNGKLVMAREKRPKATTVAIDLLGEAFGQKSRLIRKRSKSLDKPNGPLLIGGVTYVPQQQIQAPYTAPLPQQTFSAQNLMHYPPQPTFVMPNPSQQDLNKLHHMQAHFGRMYGPAAPNNPQNGKVEVTSTTITITKHICAGCGRIRSKKYHHDHPIKQGEKPEPDFCRRCQKDTSSTDTEGESQERKKKGKGKKPKHKKHNKHTKHSSDDEDSDPPETQPNSKHSPKKEPTRAASKDYIIVEEEISEDEVYRPRERGRVRERVVEDIEIRKYPGNRQSSQARARSISRKRVFGIPRKPVRPAKVKEKVVRETIRRRSPSIQYRNVEIERNSPVPEAKDERYPRQVPIHFFDDLLHEQQHSSRENYREHIAREQGSSGKDYSVEEVETISRGPLSRDTYQEQGRHVREEREKDYVIEVVEEAPRRGLSRDFYEQREFVKDSPIPEYYKERGTTLSSRAEEARHRRRRERNSPPSVSPPWEAPHVIRPTGDEDLIVVTERYEYRPKKNGKPEEDRRRQEFVDRVTLDRQQADQFSAEEAARYYHEDWSRAELEPPREPLRRTEYAEPSYTYRRDRHRDGDLSDSEASYEYRTFRKNMPRAPSPPSTVYDSQEPENWPAQPPYPVSSDSDIPERLSRARKGRGFEYPPTYNPQRGRERSRSRSTSRSRPARPAYVREATDGGPQKSLTPSPKRSRSRGRARVQYGEVTASELAEREMRAESEARHVSFRETPTVLSIQNSWTESSELGPIDPERMRAAEREVTHHVKYTETPTMVSGVSANSWTETSELGPVHPKTTGTGWDHGGGSGWNR